MLLQHILKLINNNNNNNNYNENYRADVAKYKQFVNLSKRYKSSL